MIDIRYMYATLDTDGIHDLIVHWTITLTDSIHLIYTVVDTWPDYTSDSVTDCLIDVY